VISTPRGRVDADWIVQKVLLKLSETMFSTNLIILTCPPRNGLDEDA
jgi:hypothetical protein